VNCPSPRTERRCASEGRTLPSGYGKQALPPTTPTEPESLKTARRPPTSFDSPTPLLRYHFDNPVHPAETPTMAAVQGAISKRRKFVADGVFYAELNEFFQRELAEEGYSGVEVRVTPTVTDISTSPAFLLLFCGKWAIGEIGWTDGSCALG
jgi:hypothetical protein